MTTSRTYALTLTVEEIQVIDQVLSEAGPYRVIAPLVAKINQQIGAQNKLLPIAPLPAQETKVTEIAEG